MPKKEAAQAGLSLHLSKRHIVGNHMSWLISEETMEIYETAGMLRSNIDMLYYRFLVLMWFTTKCGVNTYICSHSVA